MDGVELKAEGLVNDARPGLMQKVNAGAGFSPTSSVFEKPPGG